MSLFTYQDAIIHSLDWIGSNPWPSAQRDVRRAIQLAQHEFSNAHKWAYYYTLGRVNTVASYDTGTLAYDHSGGSYERMVTLTSGTWPSWASYGTLKIGDTAYEVASRVSDTVITVSVNGNPGTDVAAGTEYTLYRDTYPLPCDFIEMDEVTRSALWGTLEYLHPREWIAGRHGRAEVGTPRMYTITGDPNYYGSMALRFYPAPSTAYSYDFIYQRRMRELGTEEYKTGTVTSSTGSTTITGSGTTFTSKMVGSVIRFSADATDYPTGQAGANPATMERIVVGYTNGTTLTVDNSADQSLSAVKYVISDPIDVEPGVMLAVFLRCCEWQLSLGRVMKDRPSAAQAWGNALIRAREADARSSAPRVAGQARARPRLADYPAGSSIE